MKELEAERLVNEAEKEAEEYLKKADEICAKNSKKVIKAFWKEGVTETDFGSTTGYGYDDIGREKIERVFI